MLVDILRGVRQILAPPFCFYCLEYLTTDEFLCVTCAKIIQPMLSHTIHLGDRYAMQVHAASDYAGPLKSLICAKGRSDVAACKKLAELMYQYSVVRHIHCDYLVPIPLHKSRQAVRGYNQAEVIARQLSKQTGIPVLTCLQRIKKTGQQSFFSGAERYENVKGAFELTEAIQGKKVLLIDDLMTTGATLYEAGRTLVAGNPQEVHALVACRVI